MTRVRCTESSSRSDYPADSEAQAMLRSMTLDPNGPGNDSCPTYMCVFFFAVPPLTTRGRAAARTLLTMQTGTVFNTCEWFIMGCHAVYVVNRTGIKKCVSYRHQQCCQQRLQPSNQWCNLKYVSSVTSCVCVCVCVRALPPYKAN